MSQCDEASTEVLVASADDVLAYFVCVRLAYRAAVRS
jgi:hypothetical protein